MKTALARPTPHPPPAGARHQEPGSQGACPGRRGGRAGPAGGGAWTSPPHTLGRSRARQAQPAVAGWAGSALGCSGSSHVRLGSKPTTAPLCFCTHTPTEQAVCIPLRVPTPSRPCPSVPSIPALCFLLEGRHHLSVAPSLPCPQLSPLRAAPRPSRGLWRCQALPGREVSWPRDPRAPPKLMPHAASTTTSGHAAPTPHPRQPSPRSQGPRVKAAPRAERAEHPHLAGLVGVTR